MTMTRLKVAVDLYMYLIWVGRTGVTTNRV